MAPGAKDQLPKNNLSTLLKKADRGWMLARACKRDNVKSADQDKFHNKCKSPNVLSGREASFKMSLFKRSMPPPSE